jgi:hypothetical protein
MAASGGLSYRDKGPTLVPMVSATLASRWDSKVGKHCSDQRLTPAVEQLRACDMTQAHDRSCNSTTRTPGEGLLTSRAAVPL